MLPTHTRLPVLPAASLLLLFTLLFSSVVLHAQEEPRTAYFPILEIEIEGDEAIATIQTGPEFGIGTGTEGVAWSISRELDTITRDAIRLGSARVLDADASVARVRIALDDPASPSGIPWEEDLVELPISTPDGFYSSIFFELARYGVAFTSSEDLPLYDFGDILENDSPEYERRMLDSMASTIRVAAAVLREYEEEYDVLKEKIETGRFAGRSLIDAVAGTTAADVRLFFLYVRDYPGTYMGKYFALPLTYSSWVGAAAPLSESGAYEQIAGASAIERPRVVEELRENIIDYAFLDVWTQRAERLANAGSLDSARAVVAIAKETARLLDVQTSVAWSRFVEGRIDEATGNAEEAIERYRDAEKLFNEIGDPKGAGASANNLGSLLTDEARFDEATIAYERAESLKRHMHEEEPSGATLESIATTVAGKGRLFYESERWDEAIAAYEEAGRLYEEAALTTATWNKAWAIQQVGRVLGDAGRYGEARAKHEEALEIYRSLEDPAAEADALDWVAYVLSLEGRHRESLDYREKAYDIHLNVEKDKADAGFSMSNVGQAYWSLGDYYNAEKSHRLALSLREEAGDLPGQAYSWHKLGTMLNESGNPVEAIEAYEQARTIYAELDDEEHLAEVLTSVGDVYFGQQSWNAALERYTEAFELQKRAGATSAMATTVTSIGDVYRFKKQYDLARQHYEEGLEIRRRANDRQGEVYSLIGLAMTDWAVYDYDAARDRYDDAIAIAKELETKSELARVYADLGRIRTTQGKLTEAYDLLSQALGIYRETDLPGDQASTLLSLGAIDLQRGEFEKAMEKFREAEGIAIRINNRTSLSDALNQIGFTELMLGHFDEALEASRKSLDVAIDVKNPWGIGSGYNALGNTYNLVGDFREAVRYYLLSDSVYRELGDDLNRATPLNNAATIYFAQGEYDKALANLTTALEILRTAKQQDEFLVMVLSNIGELYNKQERYADAETWLNEALVIADSVQAMRMKASALGTLAHAKREQKQLEEATELAVASLELSEKAGETVQLIGAQALVGEIWYLRGDLDRAEIFTAKAISGGEEIGSKRSLWKPLYFSGLISRDRGDRAEAIRQLEHSISIIEELRGKVSGGEGTQKLFSSDREKVRVYEALIALLIEQGDVERALGYLERSNNDDLRSRFKNLEPAFADPEKQDLVEKGRSLKARIDQLADQLTKEKAGNDDGEENIERLQEIISVAENDYIKFINETIREQPELRNYFSAGVNPLELRAKKQKIPADVAVVSYLLGENQLYEFVATADTVVARVVEASRAEVEWSIRRLYRLASDPSKFEEEPEMTERDMLIESSNLYDLLIAPIEDRIEGKSKLAIVPSGSLNYLPFQLLSASSESPDFLVNRHTLFYISDLGVFLEEQGAPVAPRLVAFGNADGTLPSAEEEVNDIAALYPTSQVYLGSEATEDRAKEFPSDYNMLHFATHGNLDYNRFENSWLTLAGNPETGEDGRLTLEEIWSITNLASCTLVTLSACNTAVSEEVVEGWPINPANAFLQVGVPRVLATLWQVDDEATAILMREFYRLLPTKGAAEALRSAQTTLAADGEHAYPFYWAPFILLGDWR